MEKYTVIKNYRNDAALRASFNELAGKTFYIDFEDWYQNGYWQDAYNPYSIVLDGKVVANVSVNRTDFIWNGSRKHFIQLGTVMTDEQYRNRGLIRQIMKEIEKDCGNEGDGMYLFASASVLDFYPKFGFRKAEEYQYAKEVSIQKEKSMVQVHMRDKKAWDTLEEAIKRSIPYGCFEMVDNRGLFMFYVTKYMQENVYYDKELDVYAVAEIEDGELLLHQVFTEKEIELDKIIEAFGSKIRQVRLAFMPKDTTGYTISRIEKEDTTLFLKGNGIDELRQSKLMFPTLAHA